MNNVTQLTATPLFTQNQATSQIKTAILALEQGLDSHQKQIELLWYTVRPQCDVGFTDGSVSSVPVLDWETWSHTLSACIGALGWAVFSGALQFNPTNSKA